MSSTRSLYCIYCERRWPQLREYEMCPCCREPTSERYAAPKDWDGEPLSIIDAARLKTQYEFGWWLWFSGELERRSTAY